MERLQNNLGLMLMTVLALVAFAANSVLCRLALVGDLIDPAGFTTVRLLSGALMLLLIVLLRSKQHKVVLFHKRKHKLKNGCAAFALFIYAWFFSLAYVQLEAGAGALVLFAAVQITLILSAILTSNFPRQIEFVGMVIAFLGLLYLLYPSWGSPTLIGFVLMLFAGVAWGIYTWLGKGSEEPVLETTVAFVGCVPLVAILNWFCFEPQSWQPQGMVLAMVSGAVTSAMGYALWYGVLPKLTVMQAGVLQLLVPIMAALGGVVLLDENITMRLVVAGLMVLGGVYLVLTQRVK